MMSESSHASRSTQHVPRPFSVTLLAVTVLIFTSLGWLRMIEAIRLWSLLTDLPLSVSPLYLASSGAFWGLVGLPLVWSLYWGHRWVSRPVQFAAPAYALYYWFDRLFLAQDIAIAVRWPFAVGLTFILLAFTFWTLSRRRARAFFNKESVRKLPWKATQVE
jgi:hypothetical protein